MAQFTSYYPQPTSPVSIISPQFCVPKPLDFSIKKQVMNITGGNFDVHDINDNLVFRVKGSLFPGRRVLLDDAGNPIVTLERKIFTAHNRWEAFRGDSTDSDDLIFSAKRSSMVQRKTELDVFMANNISEYVSDFKVKGSWLEQSCTVYAGESNTIVAQIRTINDRWHVFRGKSTSSKDLLFTVKRSSMLSSMFQTNANLEVFLANNKKEEVCDFQVKGSWSDRSCVIYLGESTTIVAQLRYTNHLINYTHNLSTWYN
ncbi:hypothetical protein ACOSP7_029145 [Xanthoceras sorbifolium]